jgi:hypothetical protein
MRYASYEATAKEGGLVSVSGQLGDFDVSSILQILATRRATGCLRLMVGGDEIGIHLASGRLAAVASERMPFRIGRVLRQWGAITDAQLRDALQTQATEGGVRSLGELLVARGWVTVEQISACVHEQAVAALGRALGSRSGSFSWSPGERPPLRGVGAGLDPRLVLADAVQRAAQLRRLRDHIPPRDAPLAVANWVHAETDVANELEARILALLQAGIGSWGELAELLPVDEAGLLRTLVSMHDRRVIITQTAAPDLQTEAGRRGTGLLTEADLGVLLDPDRQDA